MKPVAVVCFPGYCVWNMYFLVSGCVPDSIFHAATGLPCPTTGGVRSIVGYLRGDWTQGFLFNPFAPLFVALFCLSVSFLARNAFRKKPVTIPNWMCRAWVASLALAWVTKFAIGPRYW